MTLATETEPYVLLDDARPGGGRGARLYRNPVDVISAHSLDQVLPALERLHAATASGLHVAGYLAYEAGLAFDPRTAGVHQLAHADDAPLLWFGVFGSVEQREPSTVSALFDGVGTGHAGALAPLWTEADYATAYAKTHDYIVAGDIYQANLTFPAHVPVIGDLLGLYAKTRRDAAAGHGALVSTGRHHLLSFSPELFFSLDDRDILTRPMKGTSLRSGDPETDQRRAQALVSDAKQRAENLMIVDLLRNDLSRVALAGTVAVPRLFDVESYPTVHQMTSTVTARLAEGLGAFDVLRALFPCGSITGAPKLRAIEILRDVERGPRGPYTGSIGWIGPGARNADFNVAIRTICVKDGDGFGTLGIGSGVVADSVQASEWTECLDKARFLYGSGASAS